MNNSLKHEWLLVRSHVEQTIVIRSCRKVNDGGNHGEASSGGKEVCCSAEHG